MACKHIIKVMNPYVHVALSQRRTWKEIKDHCTHITSVSGMSVVSLRFRLYGLLLPLHMSIGLYRVYTVFINNLYLQFAIGEQSPLGPNLKREQDKIYCCQSHNLMFSQLNPLRCWAYVQNTISWVPFEGSVCLDRLFLQTGKQQQPFSRPFWITQHNVGCRH